MSADLTQTVGDLCSIVAGKTPSRRVAEHFGGEIPWVKIGDLRPAGVFETTEHVTASAVTASGLKLLPPGTVLLSVFASIGRTSLLRVPATTNQAIVGLQPKEPGTLDARYLRRYLDSCRPVFERLSRGVAQANINLRILRGHPVPLPPLDEQRRIADVLDRADALRAKRRETVARLDELLEATFQSHVMESTSRTVALGDVVLFMRNGMSVRQQKGATGLPISRIETIAAGGIDPARCGYADLAADDTTSRWLLESGDILFSHINSPAHVGKVAMYRSEPPALVHGMNLLCLRPDPAQALARWLLAALRTKAFRASIQPFVNRAVNQASVSIGNLRRVPIELPQLAQQAVVVERLAVIEEQQRKAQTHLTHLDALFASLQQRAFRGDLFSSPLPPELADAVA